MEDRDLGPAIISQLLVWARQACNKIFVLYDCMVCRQQPEDQPGLDGETEAKVVISDSLFMVAELAG